MDVLDIPYLLGRARAHRVLGHAANGSEARSIHSQFVRNYQKLLLAIRRARSQVASPESRQATVSIACAATCE
ncbi:hypothetical protein GCM10009087_30790 [Sphingomonas oligophenolica]|uniref:Uncharacterized protein n=1 Tax=Sphingomonas oligophenolica TaxID=301154 RepID=A0ABU9Y6I3_9SPHN